MRTLSSLVIATALLSFTTACAEQKGEKKDDKKEEKADDKKEDKKDAAAKE
ncbi:hypothetical protein G6O69_32270 [Pseudenhygromyxa sp. WMMC2535]|uniref:hypothetical protein n=1 Tax=Pseudenhygromyxa sp. WMMC2535 TaxID=2712867 RepID=UPI0015532851|nr:hypothetical protein [Pseudenhygromyxa sp. WMMC2535]NVB42544.1 hypothetical protein [Pseudenhygromyxa sp. WMMC2535]